MLCYIFLGVWLFCTLFSIHLGHRFSRFHFPMIFTILVSNVIYERGSCVYRHQHKYRLVGQFFITSSLKCVAHFSFKSLRHFFLCFVCVFFLFCCIFFCMNVCILLDSFFARTDWMECFSSWENVYPSDRCKCVHGNRSHFWLCSSWKVVDVRKSTQLAVQMR